VMATAAAAILAREHVPPGRLVGAVVVVVGIALIALA
jgi:drug/metabolite transporter (DMT)-like permease